MKYFIETFGCQMNECDSLVLAGILEKNNWQKAGNIDEADLVLINTCCVRQSAENRILGHIGSLKRLKKQKPQMLIAVCGCLTQKEGAEELFRTKYPQVDLLLGTFSQGLIAEYAEQIILNKQRIFDTEECYDKNDLCRLNHSLPAGVQNYKAQLSIIYGCNNFCSYCIVPYVRGRERSREPQLIIDEIKQLAQRGCVEIELLGQNVNSYGHDLNGWNFAKLLREVTKIDGIERIRYMTSHPRDFTDELLEVITAEKKICKHFHLPVQSGCDRILQLMNRGYTAEKYLHILEKIRKSVPKCAITSDLIVGFPSESDDDFNSTLNFLQAARFDAAYTFIYSVRTGTPAAKMDGQVEEATKKARLNELMALQNPISLAVNQKFVGEKELVLIDGPSKNNPDFFCGRTDNNKIVNFAKSNYQAGQFAEMKICKAKTWSLLAEPLND